MLPVNARLGTLGPMVYRERDPERPDPSEPARERVREALIERQIRAAMDEGAFDDLPHQGLRLPIDDDSMADDWAMAHRMLKNAGVAPPWIEADKIARDRLAELDRLLGRAPWMSDFARSRARAELERLVGEANAAIERLNVEAPTDRQHRRPLELASELERFERVTTGEAPG
jgi:DnaJ homolog subfamily C member 28